MSRERVRADAVSPVWAAMAPLAMGWLLLAGGTAAAAALNDVKPDVLRVVVVPVDGQGEAAAGTAFKVAPGLYVTNRHVIDLASNPGYSIWLVPDIAGAHPLQANVRAQVQSDLALLSADNIPVPALTLDPNLPDAGSTVIALGYPGQMDDVLGRQWGQASAPDVTTGSEINSATSQDDSGASITRLVHSANVWPGNSGGPLVDQCGRVLGVNTMVHASDGLAQQNIAIASADVVRFLADNGVQPAVDTRPCTDGVMAATAASGTLAPPPRLSGTTRHDGFGGLVGVVGVWTLVAALAAGALVIVGRRSRRRVDATADDTW
jgi:S1-C subfamily serine protease